jgi:hypothetical protein
VKGGAGERQELKNEGRVDIWLPARSSKRWREPPIKLKHGKREEALTIDIIAR